VTAAELRAQGKGWQDIADATGYALSTVQDYTQIPGFADLVDHFRQEYRSERLDEHWNHGVLETLEAQRDAIEGLKERANTLAGRIEERTAGPEEVQEFCALTDQITKAADKYLKALGFTKAQRVRRKLQAQKDVTGEHGERVNIHGQLDDIDTDDPEELRKLYDQLDESHGD